MKGDIDKRFKNLECKSVYRISTLADYVLLIGRRAKGYSIPELVKWDPQFKAIFEKCFEHKKQKR